MRIPYTIDIIEKRGACWVAVTVSGVPGDEVGPVDLATAERMQRDIAGEMRKVFGDHEQTTSGGEIGFGAASRPAAGDRQ